MRELPQKKTPGILSAPMQRMKMHGLDAAQPKKKPKKVAENITEEYLRRRIDKQIGIAADADPTDETFGGMVKKIPNTMDWIDRLVRKRLLTIDKR